MIEKKKKRKKKELVLAWMAAAFLFLVGFVGFWNLVAGCWDGGEFSLEEELQEKFLESK